MQDDELDRMERQAYEALRQIQHEYERAAAPYLKILTDIHNVRPHVYYVDGKTIVPILKTGDTNP